MKTCYRLVNKKKQNDSPSLKVVITSKNQRRDLLLRSKDITIISDPVLKKLIIARDMTPDQRAEAKELLKKKEDVNRTMAKTSLLGMGR